MFPGAARYTTFAFGEPESELSNISGVVSAYIPDSTLTLIVHLPLFLLARTADCAAPKVWNGSDWPPLLESSPLEETQ